MKGVGWLCFMKIFFFPFPSTAESNRRGKKERRQEVLWSSEKNSHSFVVLVDDLSPHQKKKKNTPIIMHPRVMLCIQRTGFIIIFSLFPLPNTCSPSSMLMNSPDGRHHFLWKQPATAHNEGGRETDGQTDSEGKKKKEEKVACARMYHFHWKFPLFRSTIGALKPCNFNFPRLSDRGVSEQLKNNRRVCWFVGPFSLLELVRESGFFKMKIITLSSCEASKGVGQDHAFIACCSHQEYWDQSKTTS